MLNIEEMSAAQIRAAILDGKICFAKGTEGLKTELLALSDVDLLRRAARAWESFQKETRQSRKMEVFLRPDSTVNVEVYWGEVNGGTLLLEDILAAAKEYFPDCELPDLVIDARGGAVFMYKFGT
jgi:hypothetical protein